MGVSLPFGTVSALEEKPLALRDLGELVPQQFDFIERYKPR